MKVIRLATLKADPVTQLVAEMAGKTECIADDLFSNLPTSVIFTPEADFPASLHYMFFPSGEEQIFHWHPGGRHLLVLGDTNLVISFSSIGKDQNPYADFQEIFVPPFTLSLIRFGAGLWHKFSTPDGDGTGVIAFSFHDSDDLEIAGPGMMEELTTFWSESKH